MQRLLLSKHLVRLYSESRVIISITIYIISLGFAAKSYLLVARPDELKAIYLTDRVPPIPLISLKIFTLSSEAWINCAKYNEGVKLIKDPTAISVSPPKTKYNIIDFFILLLPLVPDITSNKLKTEDTKTYQPSAHF